MASPSLKYTMPNFLYIARTDTQQKRIKLKVQFPENQLKYISYFKIVNSFKNVSLFNGFLKMIISYQTEGEF